MRFALTFSIFSYKTVNLIQFSMNACISVFAECLILLSFFGAEFEDDNLTYCSI